MAFWRPGQAVLGYDARHFAQGAVWSVTSSEGIAWNSVTCVPDDGGQTADGPFPLAADGRLSLVIQNREAGQLPAGVLFWREK